MNTKIIALSVLFLMASVHVAKGQEISKEEFMDTLHYKFLSYDKKGTDYMLPVFRRVVDNADGKGNRAFTDYYIALKKNYVEMKGYLDRGNRYVDTLKKYYENGKIERWVVYKDGVEEGPYEVFHESGGLKLKGHFKNGKEDGVFTRYYDNGNLSSEYVMEQGEYKNEIKCFMENGKPCSVTYSSANGLDSIVSYKLDGTAARAEVKMNDSKKRIIYFYDSGKPSRISVFQDFKMVGDVYYDERGDVNKSKDELDQKDFKLAIDDYVRHNFTYPNILIDAAMESRTYVTFKLFSDGRVEIMNVKSNTHPLFEVEAKRIISGFKYKPFTINNLKDQSIVFSYPIVFKLT